MRKKLFIFIAFCLLCKTISAQNNQVKAAGMLYTRGAPMVLPSESFGSEIAIDTITGHFYQWHRDPGPTSNGTWIRIGQGVDITTGGVPPAYAPFRNQSWFALNGFQELYHYSGSGTVWDCLNCGGGSTYTSGTGISIDGSNVISNTGDLSNSNEIQQVDTFRVFGTQLQLSLSGDGVPAKLSNTPSLYSLWPTATVNSYQNSTQKRNWIIYNNNIQESSEDNAFARFDSITNPFESIGGYTTNAHGNGIWNAWSSGAGNILAGFSNNLQHGMGFHLMQDGGATSSDWRIPGLRGSVLTAQAFGTGSSDLGISFYKSTNSTLAGMGKILFNDELGAIRFIGCDSTRAMNSTTGNGLRIPAPSSAIVGYAYGTYFNNAHYGGLGFWTTNGSVTPVRTFVLDSTASTTVRFGVNTPPSRINTAQIKGLLSTAGSNSLAVHNSTGTSNSLIVTNDGKTAIGTATPDVSAKLDVSSTTGGVLLPRMTTTQRDAITSPADGLVIFNTTTAKFQGRAGGAWVDLH